MTGEDAAPSQPVAGSAGHALCRGAFTIVNGIACGLGGACGVDLRMLSRFELTDRAGEVQFEAHGIGAEPDIDDRLARACALALLRMAGAQDRLGARVETASEIPATRGLKSSSAAANAINLAGLAALGRGMEPIKVVQLGVNCAIDANVTLTGAYDDAVATMFGGAVLTDNEEFKIITWPEMRDDLRVVFLVPERRIAKSSLHRADFLPIRDEVHRAFEKAREGDVAIAITLNGRAYAPILGVDNGPADAAIAAGAWAAGMSGTGPAIAVLVTDEALEDVLAALAPYPGTIIRSSVNTIPARTLSAQEYAALREEVAGGDAVG